MKGQLILAFRSKILELLRLDNLLADYITSWTDFYDKDVKSLLMSSPTFHYYWIRTFNIYSAGIFTECSAGGVILTMLKVVNRYCQEHRL